MRHILISILPLVAAVSLSAQTADPGHPRDKAETAPTTTDAAPDYRCPMMEEGGHGMAPGSMTPRSMTPGSMPHGHAMPANHMEHCAAMQTKNREKGEKK